MRKLDRSRPFGICNGAVVDGIAFNQDGLPFDRDGNEIVEGKAGPVVAETADSDWRSLPWPDLKKLGATHSAPANLKRPDLIAFIEKASA